MPKWFNDAGMAALRLRGFERRSFEYRSSEVYYIEGGPRAAPVMAVLPGFGDTIFSWVRFLAHYSSKYRVIGLDFPGYLGASPHPPGPTLTFADQDAVARKFLLEKAPRADLLVGNSMGGWLGLRFAHRHPERVGRVIAFNPAGIAVGEQEGQRIAGLYDINSYLDYLRLMRHLWHRIPPLFYPAFYLGFYQYTRQPIFRTLLTTIEPGDYLDAYLHEIKTPVSVVWGASDGLLPRSCGRLISEKAPNAKFHLIEGAGHMPQFEAPRAVYRIVDEAAGGLRRA